MQFLRFLILITEPILLISPIGENWNKGVKETHRQSRTQVVEGLGKQFGGVDLERKVDDFSAIGSLPSSIVAHHNMLVRQVRDAFVAGQYYPALTGASLWESVFSIISFSICEKNFCATPEFKYTYGKSSFDDWSHAIKTLEAWRVLKHERQLHCGSLSSCGIAPFTLILIPW